MPTPKELLWKQYYDLVKRGMHKEAREILSRIHSQAPTKLRSARGGCGRCRKRFN